MRLFPADKEIRLYEEGFGTSDFLGRQLTGAKLSALVDGIEDPIVIALDGAWGTGKTHFLKRWVGAHTIENDGIAQPIYFDAFQSDYLEDPLIAITAAIGARVERSGSKTGWRKLKTAAYKLAKPATRVSLAVATYGATDLAGAVADAAIEAGGKELERAADAFWKKEDGRRAAMDQLRSALASLTAPDAGKPPLVIVVDELDRCRPDYALGILEVIKHFFTVPRVHFVLGVNLLALQNSVRARYGNGIAAEEYLRRFVTLSMYLPDRVGREGEDSVATEYFKRTSKEMGLRDLPVSVFQKHLSLLDRHRTLSIRDIGRLLSHIALLTTTTNFETVTWGWREAITSMLLMKILAPDLYADVGAGRASFERAAEFYGGLPTKGRDDNAYDHDSAIIRGVLQLLTGVEIDNEERDQYHRAFDGFGRKPETAKTVRIVRDDYLEAHNLSPSR